MKNKSFFAAIILLFSHQVAIGQNRDYKTPFYNGVFLEYGTLVITQNIKLFSDLNYYSNKDLIMSLQPGFEFLYSLPGAKSFYPGSPYYDLNFLGAFQFYPNYGISIKPFLGLSYRLYTHEYENESSFVYLKYGATLDLNVAQDFKVIGKVMNVPTESVDENSVFIGIGISFKLF